MPNQAIEIQDLPGPEKVLDVRSIPCSAKHDLIFRVWLALPVGDYFILWNGRDPVPLHRRFSEEWPGAFTWEYLVKGPDEVRVKIKKLEAVAAPTEAETACDHHH